MSRNPVKSTTKPRGAQAMKWIFTINNYNDDSLTLLHESKEFKYLIVGKEIAPTTLTPHLQGYVVFKTVKRMPQVSKLLPHAFLAQAKGTHEQCIAYSKKEGDFQEFGEVPIDGNVKGGEATKAKFETAWNLAVKGQILEIDADIRFKFLRNIKQIQIEFQEEPDALAGPCGIWLHGESGAGKTFKARAEYPNAYRKRANIWFDGFNKAKHDAVIIDDLEPGHAQFMCHHLNIWADEYPFNADTKGGTISIRPKTVIVTSRFTIEQFCQDLKHSESEYSSIARRFTQILVVNDRQPKKKSELKKLAMLKKFRAPGTPIEIAHKDLNANMIEIINKPPVMYNTEETPMINRKNILNKQNL